MRKDENPAELDVCFSDVWAVAQRSRSHELRLLLVTAWRKLWRRTASARFGHVVPPAGRAREKAGV